MLHVKDIKVAPNNKGVEWIGSSVQSAIDSICKEDAAVRVLYGEMGPAFEEKMQTCTIHPAQTYQHLLNPKNKIQVERLTDTFNIAWKSRQYEEALKTLKQMSKFAPGFANADMLNHYTTSLHLCAQKHPLVVELFTKLYGENYQLLHNRASFRAKGGELEVKRAGLHKEGLPGEVGYIVCLPGQRYFCIMHREHEKPLDPPGPTHFRKVSECELTDPMGAHEVISLNVEIPPGRIAIILFDHYKPHGIDHRGYGVHLYLSACNDEKLRKLSSIRADICKRGKYKIDHDPRMRDANLSYLDTIHIGLIAGMPDQLWPSGKVIYANGAHTQSHGPNRSKFIGGDLQYRLPEADAEEALPAAKRRRLRECGLGHLPPWVDHIQWKLDPNELPMDQRRHWGIPK